MTALPHPEPISGESYSAVELAPGNDFVVMLDQRELPERETYVELGSVEEVTRAIRDMVVRGAPAIGISAAYGMVLAARAGARLDEAAQLLKAARPTAVNLSWAVNRMMAAAAGTSPGDLSMVLAAAARAIHREDVAACGAMGRVGAERIPDGAAILTHCNAGALATGGFGTALGVIRAAARSGKRVRVFADETRPYLQGARLTAWELAKSGITVEVLVDGAAGYLFSRGEVSLAIVGADRIAANGDVANKIGTYAVACLATLHARPFYVAAPWSTVDLTCATGADIVIEERHAAELTHIGERRVVPEGVSVRNPAFDVTPARLVSAIFTERGAAEPVSSDALALLANAP
jgi:methylthioribose-1-phosphate isomerase